MIKIIFIGAWSPLYFNNVFICPCLYSNKFIDNYLMKDKIVKQIIEITKEKYKKYLYENLYDEKMSCIKFSANFYKEFKDLEYVMSDQYSDILSKIIDYEEKQIFYDFENTIPKDKNEKYIIPIDVKRKIIPKDFWNNVEEGKTILHNSWIKNLNKFKILINFITPEVEDNFDIKIYDSDNFIKNHSEFFEETGENQHLILGMFACHELYHKWQFSATKFTPILYFANHIVSLLIGYKNASLNKWFIEGDVRKYVDNPTNSLEFLKLNNVIEYIRLVAGIFMFKKFLNDEKFSNYSKELRQRMEFIKFKFNQYFLNKFEIDESVFFNERYKNFIKQSKENNDNNYNINIKSFSEYKYMIKLMKEEKILTDEFLEFLDMI